MPDDKAFILHGEASVPRVYTEIGPFMNNPG